MLLLIVKKTMKENGRRGSKDNCNEGYLHHFMYSYIILINFKISKKYYLK